MKGMKGPGTFIALTMAGFRFFSVIVTIVVTVYTLIHRKILKLILTAKPNFKLQAMIIH